MDRGEFIQRASDHPAYFAVDKLAVHVTKLRRIKNDLPRAYMHGVAESVLAIAKKSEALYPYNRVTCATFRFGLVAFANAALEISWIYRNCRVTASRDLSMGSGNVAPLLDSADKPRNAGSALTVCGFLFEQTLAIPVERVSSAVAYARRDDLITGTDRSRYPKQINNVLCFPCAIPKPGDPRLKDRVSYTVSIESGVSGLAESKRK